MKIKNLKKSLAVLTAAVLLAASIPMSAFNVFAASSTYDITYKDGSATVGGQDSTVDEAFKVLEIKETTTEYGEATVNDGGSLSIPLSPRHSTTYGDNKGNYMFTVQNAPAGDLLSYELTIPNNTFVGRPNGLQIPLYYDASNERYVSVCMKSGIQIARAFITAKYFGYYRNSDGDCWFDINSVSSVNVKVSYTYDGDTISRVDLVFNFYDSENSLYKTYSRTYTSREILAVVNINSSTTGLNGKPATWEEEDVNVTSLAKSGALAGFISGNSADKNCTISSFKASYSKDAGDVAAEFVNEYKSYITMDESAVTADKANDVIAAYSAYNELDDAVKTVLADYVIGEVHYNVGEKLAALNNAALLLLPTPAQTAFENYYTAQNIADLTVADGNLAVINEALGLYNAVEDTHKVNVSTQYAHIISLLDSFVNNLSRFDTSLGANTFTYAPGEFGAYPNLLGYMNNRIWSTSSGGQSRVSSDLLAATDVRKVTAVFNKASAAGAVVNMVSDLKADGEDTGVAWDDSCFGAVLKSSSGIILADATNWNLSVSTANNAIVAKSVNSYGFDNWSTAYETVDSDKYAGLDYIALELDYQYEDDSANSRSKLYFTMKLWADNGDGVYSETDDVLIDTADRSKSKDVYNFIVVKYYNDAPRTLQYGIPEATVAKLYSVKLSTAADETSAAAYNFVEAHKAAITAASATAENAQAIIDAYTAYTALDDAVKTVLNDNYVIDGVAYNVGEKLAALNNAALLLLPTPAQTAFEEHYNAKIADLTAAKNENLADINTALELYNAVEDSHKGNVSTQYAHICDLLDGYFITNNDETLTKDLTYDASLLTEYGYVNSYFKNSVFVETANSRNNKVTDPAKFDSTKARSVKVAFKYGEKNTAGTAYKYNVGFSFFPVLDSINGLSNTENKIFYSFYRERKTLYINGESQVNKTIYLYYLPFGTLGDIAKISTNTSNQFFRSSEFGSFEMLASSFGSPTVNTKYDDNVIAGIYQLPATRIVFDFDYTVTTTKDAQGYKVLYITFSNITVWAESDGDNTYNADNGDIRLTKLSSGTLAYRYTEETAPMPFFSTDDASLDSMLYFNSSVDYTFEEKYDDILDNPSPDANKTLKMYAEYQADPSAVLEGTAAKVETAVSNAGLRPTAGGATLSVSADPHIAFFVDKPVAAGVESTVGAIVSTYNYMVESGNTVLTKDIIDAGILKTAPQSNEYCGENQLMLKVKNLYGAANNWGRWIVVRYYATYTVNGNEVVIYSTGENANNPASATGVSHDGVAIRSINGLIKKIADTMATKVGEKGNTVGISYNDKNGVPQNTYTDTRLRDAYAANKNSTIYKTALDTMYFLMSYKNALI